MKGNCDICGQTGDDLVDCQQAVREDSERGFNSLGKKEKD